MDCARCWDICNNNFLGNSLNIKKKLEHLLQMTLDNIVWSERISVSSELPLMNMQPCWGRQPVARLVDMSEEITFNEGIPWWRVTRGPGRGWY